MTERQIIDKILAFLNHHAIKGLQSPDYLTTNYYSPQWRAFGAVNYYQLPNEGRIIAVIDRCTREGVFNPEGVAKDDIYAWH